jgi:predicted signal transduction protein with EAL and GGDEF domain
MSSSEKAVFVKPANTLRRRAERGRGVAIEEMMQAADQVLEAHTASGRDELLAAIAEARAAIVDWRRGGDRATLVAKLGAMASEGESQGHVLGNPLLTEVSTRLGAFVSLLAKAVHEATDAKAATATALHLDAMIVALERKKDGIDEEGQTLLSNLELTQRTIR